LLTLSRDEELQPRIVPINEMVRSLEPMLHQLAGTTTIVVRPAPEAGNVNADPARLQEVLLVLSQQALDSVNGQRGRILISTRRTRKALRSGAEGGEPLDVAVIEISSESATERHLPAPATPTDEMELATAFAFVRRSGGTLEAEVSPV